MGKIILHQTLKKEWFEMIASGEKLEEYRDIKDYWVKRLIEYPWYSNRHDLRERLKDLNGFKDTEEVMKMYETKFKQFDIVRFRNGYSRFAPVMDVELKFITIDYGMTTWGAPEGKRVFIQSLGKVLSINRHDEILNDNYIPTAY